MKLFNFISLLLLFSLPAVNGFAQSAAQTTMQVRVEVVSALGIDAIQPKVVKVFKEKVSTLAQLRVIGAKMQDLMIDVSHDLLLKDEEGKQIHLKVMDQIDKLDPGAWNIELLGHSDDKIDRGLYRGILTATVEYL